jgi:hypothetical protein
MNAHLSLSDCVANSHPGRVSQSGTRAGIQTTSPRRRGTRHQVTSLNVLWIPGSRFAPSGMTGSANCDIVSRGRGDSSGAKLVTVFRHSDLNSSIMFVVLHCSPFTVYSVFCLLSSVFLAASPFPRLPPSISLRSMPHALCAIGTPVAYDYLG